MTKYPHQLLILISYLKKLPGVGTKTAERLAFHLLSWQSDELKNFSTVLADLKEKLLHCQECGCLMDEQKCPFCTAHVKDPHLLCVISSSKDVYAIEETHTYQGLYHVLGGLLSPLEGKSVEHLNLPKLKERIVRHQIKEIIIALDSTLEGDATALYLKEELAKWGVTTSRLAFGLPMGSSLDYVDGGTLARAFLGRHTF